MQLGLVPRHLRRRLVAAHIPEAVARQYDATEGAANDRVELQKLGVGQHQIGREPIADRARHREGLWVEDRVWVEGSA